ncbi:MAG TPA: phosphatase PAP2 family protein [Proteiniphilum sp.]|nr:phosphatase PAP2 family protein [Proteiniphilum sp.]HPD87105.1 phosphatase PAP2 family protein [Proteiniphilum sp.]HPJ49857.1 phosphatase PAP2 family protein [Proteiniphilum sp.]HPR19345.1 phosphatase PAP2 family protein [Proteiniphilum sp.]
MKEAIENLIPLERDLFFLLNGSDSSFLDDWMWTVSGRFVWIPLFLAILFLFFYRTPRKQALLVTLFFILVFVLSDQLSSGFCKPFFERFRPTHHPDFKELVDIVNGYRGGRYGFISGHATNSFGLAVFLSLLFRHRGVTLAALSWALLNSYTRIYLGVHFISDIVAGMLAGSLLAFLLYRLMILLLSRLPATQDLSAGTLYYRKQGNWLAMFILAYLFLLTLFSPLMASLPH